MNSFARARARRSADARQWQLWIAISLTDRAKRSIFGASKLLLGPKPRYENRSPAQQQRHACVHDAALFLGGNRRLLLLLTAASQHLTQPIPRQERRDPANEQPCPKPDRTPTSSKFMIAPPASSPETRAAFASSPPSGCSTVSKAGSSGPRARPSAPPARCSPSGA